MKQSFQPFSIKFKPLLDEIAEREKALRELARGAAMVEILGTCPRSITGKLSDFPPIYTQPLPVLRTGKPVM